MRLLYICILSLLFVSELQAKSFDHTIWGSLLKENVHQTEDGKNSLVDYDGMLQHKGELQTYLGSLAKISKEDFDTWERDEQLAFLINVYNSWTVKLILTRYPDVKSIKDLGSLFSSPWKKKIVQLFGKEYSLDDIEHGFIRGSGKYNDPRIHFAVNCASIGCPALGNQAYTGEELQQQLASATYLFLSDISRNRFTDGRLEVSSLFKWYRADFEKGWLGFNSLQEFFSLYAEDLKVPPSAVQSLQANTVEIQFLSYDWRLNRLP